MRFSQRFELEENSIYLSHLQKYVSHILHIQLARW